MSFELAPNKLTETEVIESVDKAYLKKEIDRLKHELHMYEDRILRLMEENYKLKQQMRKCLDYAETKTWTETDVEYEDE